MGGQVTQAWAVRGRQDSGTWSQTKHDFETAAPENPSHGATPPRQDHPSDPQHPPPFLSGRQDLNLQPPGPGRGSPSVPAFRSDRLPPRTFAGGRAHVERWGTATLAATQALTSSMLLFAQSAEQACTGEHPPLRASVAPATRPASLVPHWYPEPPSDHPTCVPKP